MPTKEIQLYQEVEGFSDEDYCSHISKFVRTNLDTLAMTPVEMEAHMPTSRCTETVKGLYRRITMTKHQVKVEKEEEARLKTKKHHSIKHAEVIVATARSILRQLGVGGRLVLSHDSSTYVVQYFLFW